MTETNYLKAIEFLGEKIARLETDILLKDYEIKSLKSRLIEAEEAKKGDAE